MWLEELSRNNLINLNSDGVVALNSEVSGRFGLALNNEHTFIVMPEKEAVWAKDLPWSRACMYHMQPILYLCVDEFEVDNIELAEFGISFLIPDFMKAYQLSLKKEVQLRNYIYINEEKKVNKTPIITMPIHILESDERVFESKERSLKMKVGK